MAQAVYVSRREPLVVLTGTVVLQQWTSDVFPIEVEEGGGVRRASRSDGLCRLQTQTHRLTS